MFITHEVTLDTGFATARSRLAELVTAGGLHCSSESAYGDGLATLIRVGPFGNVWGASKLVRVSFLEPVDRGDTVTQPLRWEATGN
ncbi:MAG TPA: hypothetical protein VGS19_14270, partial [Streptosporangiaceae bacterium]|nr:hypothetical protein [Streptosporangiaceae bacterium]